MERPAKDTDFSKQIYIYKYKYKYNFIIKEFIDMQNVNTTQISS